MSVTFKPLDHFDTAVSLGAISNTNGHKYAQIGKFGKSSAVGTTPVLISSLGGSVPFRPAPKFFRVRVGGNVADDVAGSGARSIRISGLRGSDLTFYDEPIPLSGADASVDTSETFWRVYRASVIETGVYGGVNAGDIVIEDEDGNAHMQILAGEGQTQFCSFSIPADYGCQIRRLVFTVEGNKNVSFQFGSCEAIDVVTPPGIGSFRIRREYRLLPSGVHVIDLSQAPIVIEPKADVFIRGFTATGTSAASANIIGLFVPSS